MSVIIHAAVHFGMGSRSVLRIVLLLGAAPLACGRSHGLDVPPPDAVVDAGADVRDSRAIADSDLADSGFECTAFEVVDSVAPAELGLGRPPAGSSPLRVGLFFTVPEGYVVGWSRTDLVNVARRVVTNINTVLSVCGIHASPETVQVIALPERLMTLDGNERGSLGGHPPPDDPCPLRTNYDEGARLTAEARELFTYGKCVTSANAISIFTIRRVIYYRGDVRSAAGGLSFSPNSFHDPDDYPARNSVLLVGQAIGGALPRIEEAITPSHELGHMLLSSGLHEPAPNLMSGSGTELRPEQCDTMRANLLRLFGDDAAPDPGRPTCD